MAKMIRMMEDKESDSKKLDLFIFLDTVLYKQAKKTIY